MKYTFILAAAVALAVLSGGCDKSGTPTSGGTAGAAGTGASSPSGNAGAQGTPGGSSIGLPAGLIVEGTVATATPVGQAKTAAKMGDKVTVVGRIGGSRTPFVANRSVFTIIDPALKSCDQMGEKDHCDTPWDYCCEPQENLRRNMATVEIVGADGKALPFTVKGAQGLQPLATVAVTGTVVERNDQGVFVVRAEKISVQ